MYKNQTQKLLWFDTDHIKDINTLTEDQVESIKKWSFSPLVPLYFLFKWHWDFIAIFVLIEFLSSIIEATNNDNLIPTWFFVSFFGYLLFLILAMKHVKRLDWNRNKYESFEAFEKNHAKWHIVGIIFMVIAILFLSMGLFLFLDLLNNI